MQLLIDVMPFSVGVGMLQYRYLLSNLPRKVVRQGERVLNALLQGVTMLWT